MVLTLLIPLTECPAALEDITVTISRASEPLVAAEPLSSCLAHLHCRAGGRSTGPRRAYKGILLLGVAGRNLTRPNIDGDTSPMGRLTEAFDNQFKLTTGDQGELRAPGISQRFTSARLSVEGSADAVRMCRPLLHSGHRRTHPSRTGSYLIL